MNTVARGLILPILDWARASGCACEGLFDGLPFDESALRGDLRRVRWNEYVELHARLARAVGGVDRLAALIASLPTPSIDWLLASLETPAQLYRLWREVSPLLWGSVRVDVDEAPDGLLDVRLRLPDDFPDATIWFQVVGGFLASMPQRIGLPPAEIVSVRVSPHLGEWRLRAPGRVEGRSAPPPALHVLTELSEDYGAALRELAAVRRRMAEPPPDLDARVAAARSAWQLTPAQAQVLKGVVRGLSNKEIAAELGNAEATVEVHVTRLLRKAGAPGRTALVTRFWGALS